MLSHSRALFYPGKVFTCFSFTFKRYSCKSEEEDKHEADYINILVCSLTDNFHVFLVFNWFNYLTFFNYTIYRVLVKSHLRTLIYRRIYAFFITASIPTRVPKAKKSSVAPPPVETNLYFSSLFSFSRIASVSPPPK